MYAVGVLTVSDTSSRSPSTDASGPLLRELVEKSHDASYRIVVSDIVPDDADKIITVVKRWCDELKLALVLSTGGTGFGVRDVTPEAISSLIQRPTPGLTHHLLSSSLARTPLAALSRLISGIRGTSLIVSLPGSPKAIRECAEALFGGPGLQTVSVMSHALELVTGGNGASTHAEMDRQEREGDGQKTSASREGRSRQEHPHLLHHHSHAHGRGHGTSHDPHHQHHHGHNDHRAPVPRTRQFVSNDPSKPVGARQRSSPYPIISLSKALSLIDEHTPSPICNPRNASESDVHTLRVDEKLLGYVLAEDVAANWDIPRARTTNVDGYAVRASDGAGTFKVLTSRNLPSTQWSTISLPAGHIYRVNTGQALPPGADAVVMVEDTRLVSSRSISSASGSATGSPANPTPTVGVVQGQDIEEEDEVELLVSVSVAENVRPPGSDVRAGDVVLRAGQQISALGGEVGTLAFVGRRAVKVFRKPTVAVLSTGEEIKDLHDSDGSGGEAEEERTISGGEGLKTVTDTNRPALKMAIESQGYKVVDLGIVGDNIPSTLAALRRGLSSADLVITTGGTSMGESDVLKPLLERELDATIHFGRVAMKPGKPTSFATTSATVPSLEGDTAFGHAVQAKKLVFALPGNPASALVCFYVFILPALRKLSGYGVTVDGVIIGRPWEVPRVKVRLADPMRLDPRPEFHRVIISPVASASPITDSDPSSPVFLQAHSTGGQRSSRMASMATANGLVCLPGLQPGPGAKTRLDAGEVCEAMLLGPLVPSLL